MKKNIASESQMPDTSASFSGSGTVSTASRASGGRNSELARIEKPEPETIVQYQTVYVPQPAVGQPDGKGKAIASLVLGLVGLVLSVLAPELSGIPAIFGLLICIVGIVYGIKGRNRLPVGVPGRGIATAGLTLSIIGAIISGLMTLAVVCLVVGIFALCSTTPTANIDYYTAIYSIFFFI